MSTIQSFDIFLKSIIIDLSDDNKKSTASNPEQSEAPSTCNQAWHSFHKRNRKPKTQLNLQVQAGKGCHFFDSLYPRHVN